MATLNVILQVHFSGPTQSSKMFKETIILKRRINRKARNKWEEKIIVKRLGERQRKEWDTKIIALEWRAEEYVGSLAQIWGRKIYSYAETFPSLPSSDVNAERSYIHPKKPWYGVLCWPEFLPNNTFQESYTTACTTNPTWNLWLTPLHKRCL